MEKKNPYVTTIGFNKNDPDHIYVAKLLNEMGRRKAGYIVKAVLLCQDMLENGKVVPTGSINYEHIRKIVYQVLEEKETELAFDKGSDRQVVGCQSEKWKEDDVLPNLDADAMSDILASIVAFQEGDIYM